MGHAIRIQSREQYIAAIRVLDKLPGMWRGIGPASAPVLLVLDSHYKALVKAGVVSPNGKEGQGRDKKASAKKAKS
jgi:cell division GTPase FtsZ